MSSHLDGAIVVHVHTHLLLVLFSIFLPQGLFHQARKSVAVVELQKNRRSARVQLDLHPQDAVSGPLISHVLQAVDRRARKCDVDVRQNKENQEGLKEERRKTHGIRAAEEGKYPQRTPGPTCHLQTQHHRIYRAEYTDHPGFIRRDDSNGLIPNNAWHTADAKERVWCPRLLITRNNYLVHGRWE